MVLSGRTVRVLVLSDFRGAPLVGGSEDNREDGKVGKDGKQGGKIGKTGKTGDVQL
jgi:hypothetical protein